MKHAKNEEPRVLRWGGPESKDTPGTPGGWKRAVSRLMRSRRAAERPGAPVPVEPEVVELVLELAGRPERMSIGEMRSWLLRRMQRRISYTTVVNILIRHGKWRWSDRGRLNEAEMRMLDGRKMLPCEQRSMMRLNPSLRERGGVGEGNGPGEVLTQTLFPVDLGAAWGRWQMHVVVDTWGVVAFARLCQDGTTINAVDFLDGEVLPWYERHGVKVRVMQTSRHRTFSGCEGEHMYGIYLELHGIGQSVIPVGRLRVNGYMARFKQILMAEWLLPLRVRKKAGQTGETARCNRLEALNGKLADWLEKYNRSHPITDYRNMGRSPLEFWANAPGADAPASLAPTNAEPPCCSRGRAARAALPLSPSSHLTLTNAAGTAAATIKK